VTLCDTLRNTCNIPRHVPRRHTSTTMITDTHLQHTCNPAATHFITLHHTATLCHTPHTATHCNTPVTRCRTPQQTVTHRNTLQHTASHYSILSQTALHCKTLERTVLHCNTFRHTATHCNTPASSCVLQRTATPRAMQYLRHTASRCNTLPHMTTRFHTL